MASNQTNPMNLLDSTNATGVGTGGSLTVSGGVSIEKDTYIGGNVAISGTTTSFSDNMVIINANPQNSVDTGILFQRYSSDISNSNNYSAIIYDETNDRFKFGYIENDPNRTIGSLISNIPIQTNTMISDLVTTTNLITTNLTSNNMYVNNYTVANYTFTTTDITASNISSTNSTFSNIILTNVTNTNSLLTNAIISNITATNSLLTNVISTNVLSTNLTSTNAVLSNAVLTTMTSPNSVLTNITSTNAVLTNAVLTTLTSPNSVLTNITSTNSVLTNITSTNAVLSNAVLTTLTSPNSVLTNITSTNAVLTNAVLSNITSTNIVVNSITGGNMNISGTLTVVNITSTNLVETNAIITSLTSSSAVLTNALATNLTSSNAVLTNVTISNLANIVAAGNSNTIGPIITTGGNVGIGSLTPGEKLQIAGNLRIGNSTQANYIAFHGTAGDNPSGFDHTYIGERRYGGTEQSELIIFKGNDPVDTNGPDRIRMIAGEIAFETYTTFLSGTFEGIATSGGTRRMTINTGGQVIIPSAVLTNSIVTNETVSNLIVTAGTVTNSIFTNITSTSLRLTNEISTNATVTNANLTNAVVTNQTVNSLLLINTLTATDDCNTVGSIITTGGNVGIGTVSPKGKLTLSGGVGASGPHIWAYNTNSQFPLSQFLNWGSDNMAISFDGYFDDAWRTSSTSASYQIYKFNNILRFNYANGSAGSNVSSFTAAMVVTTNGNIGMGTTAPSTKLQVNGSLYVTSTITTANLTASSITASNLNVPGTLTVTNVTVNNFIQSNGSLVVTGNSNTIGQIIMNSAGNVGISTTNPIYNLDVNGTIARSGVPLPLFSNGSFTGVTSVDIPTNFVNSSYNYCEIKMRIALASVSTNILIKAVNNSNVQLNPSEARENTVTNTGVTSGTYTSGYLTFNMEHSLDGNCTITIVKPVTTLVASSTSRAHFRSYSVYCNSGVGATRLDGAGFFESYNTSLKSIRLLLTNTSSASFSGSWSTINYY